MFLFPIEQRNNGIGDESKLKTIQKLCEDLAENILILKQLLEQMNWGLSNYDEIKTKIDVAFQTLVKCTFVVVKQPPQVSQH